MTIERSFFVCFEHRSVVCSETGVFDFIVVGQCEMQEVQAKKYKEVETTQERRNTKEGVKKNRKAALNT